MIIKSVEFMSSFLASQASQTDLPLKKRKTNKTTAQAPQLSSKPSINTGVSSQKASKIREFKLLLAPVSHWSWMALSHYYTR